MAEVQEEATAKARQASVVPLSQGAAKRKLKKVFRKAKLKKSFKNKVIEIN